MLPQSFSSWNQEELLSLNDRALHFFPAQDDGHRLEVANSHSCEFTLVCELLQFERTG